MGAGDVIYLDHNASTPCDPRVVEAMLPFLSERFANPTSRAHVPGRDAFAALETSRAAVARALDARAATTVTFTSGATEAGNLAIRGVAAASGGRRRRLISQVTEHAAVLAPLARLERDGWEVVLLGVDVSGRIRLEELEAALGEDTLLVSLMAANNETGTLQPVADAAALAHAAGALVHCDAAQAVGKIPVSVRDLDVDLLSLSGHKLYGPKGIGALYARPGLRLEPLLEGGGQERGLRSGTVNLPAVVGLAEALRIATEGLPSEAVRLAGLRDRLEESILSRLDGVSVHGATDARLPNTTSLGFAGVDGAALLASLPDVAVSTGSACTSSSPEPSAVLRAMGVPAPLAAASLRFSLGRGNGADEIDRAAGRVVEEVTRLRRMRRR
jgi:cysteine desulfurase